MKALFNKFIGGNMSVIPIEKIDFNEVIRLIRDDRQIKALVDEIRNEQDTKKQKALKNKLPYITSSGLFPYRNDKSLLIDSYTWICPIDVDIDDNNPKIMEQTLQRLVNDEIVIFVAKSPRGNGIKAFIQMEAGSYEPTEQYSIFKNYVYPLLEKRWDCKLDYRQGVLSQPFYITHDPNIYINEKYKRFCFDIDFVPIEAVINGDVTTEIKDLKPLAYGIINQQKNKWTYFNNVAMFAGGLFAGGLLKAKEGAIINTLLQAANQNNWVEDKHVAEKQIRDGFRHGKTQPIDKDTLKAKRNIRNVLGRLAAAGDTSLDIMRVGGTYYEKIMHVNAKKEREPQLMAVSRQTLIDDYGINYLERVPKYKKFCNVPDYQNHQYQIEGNYNLFQPFTHEANHGEWPTIKKLLTHIFGDQYELGLDYMQLLYRDPTQILPVLCIVSQLNHTGKTTFGDFLAIFFKGNVAIIGSRDFEGNFNQHFISKQIIAIDESEFSKTSVTPAIKQFSTQKSAFRKGKFQDEVEIDFFGKLIILSNRERDFINIKDSDIRYWVRKAPEIKPADYDGNFLEKCKAESPSFADFLLHRTMANPEAKSRAWFTDEQLNTTWRDEAKHANKSPLYMALEEKVLEWHETNIDKPVIVGRASDFKNYLLNGDYDFTVKYVSKVLRDEFGIEPIMSRNKTNLSEVEHNVNVSGQWFELDVKRLSDKNSGTDQNLLHSYEVEYE
jgi:hypothetical protein